MLSRAQLCSKRCRFGWLYKGRKLNGLKPGVPSSYSGIIKTHMVENTRVLKNNFVGIILNTQNSRTEHYFWGFEKQTRTKRNRFRNLEKEQKFFFIYELVCTVYTSTVHTFIVFLRGRYNLITFLFTVQYIVNICSRAGHSPQHSRDNATMVQ